jgi:hypothetical protein
VGINKSGFTCYFLDPDDIVLEIILPPKPGVSSDVRTQTI